MPASGGFQVIRHVLPVAAVIAFALLAYSNSFDAPFLYDNNDIILKDTRIHAATAEHIRRILGGPYWETILINLYRPLTTLSYLFNYSVLGNGPTPAGYHWVNFGLHAANIGLVYALGLVIFEQMPPALLLSALWSIHPVLTESVTNIVGRADLLAGFGVLASLLSYHQARHNSGRTRAAWLVAVALATAIGIASKESAIVVIGVLLLYDLAFVRRVLWRSQVPAYAAAATPCILFLAARAHALAKIPYSPAFFTDNPLVAPGFWTSRLTAVKVMEKYLLLLAWPQHLSHDYSYNAVPLFGWNWNSWEDWKTAAAFLICIAAAIAAVWFWRRDRRVFFGIGFFFVTLTATSNIFLIIGTVMAERFLYLPAVGFLVCAICALEAVWRRFPGRQALYRYAAGGAMATVLVAGAARTHERNRDWSDETRFWTSAVEAAPGSYKPHLFAAMIAPRLTSADWSRALENMDQAMRILGNVPDQENTWSAYMNAGNFYRAVGNTVAAATSVPPPLSGTTPGFWFRRSLEVLKRSEKIVLATNEQYLQHSRHEEAGGTFLPAQLYLEMGRTYLSLADKPSALAALERGRGLESDPDLLEELASLYRQQGNLRGAAAALVEALYVDANRGQIRPQLIDLYSAIDPSSCAVTQAGGARELNTECPPVHHDICAAARNVAGHYQQRGQDYEAAESRRNAEQTLGCDAAELR